jgi:hypothetical protein
MGNKYILSLILKHQKSGIIPLKHDWEFVHRRNHSKLSNLEGLTNWNFIYARDNFVSFEKNKFIDKLNIQVKKICTKTHF